MIIFLKYLNIIKLQKTLGINNINYKERSSYQIKERKTIVEKKYYRYYHGRAHGLETCFNYFTPGSLAGMIFIQVLIFSSILAAKGAFNENNTKDNYNKNYAKVIDKINLSLFGFLAYIIVSYFIIFTWITNRCEFYSEYKIIKKIVLILLGIIYLSYEVLIIIKLVLSYKIKKGKIKWLMRCDYVLLVFIFFFILYSIKHICFF